MREDGATATLDSHYVLENLGETSLIHGLRRQRLVQRREVPAYRFTAYFENEVLRKRPYLRKEWCTSVLENPVRCELQEHNRYCCWAAVPELGGRYLRVITLEDKVTIHNAFPDRRFKP